MLLLIVGIVLLLLLTATAFVTLATLLQDRRRLDILTERLATENRIELMTRATLQAMRDTARQVS